MAALMTRPQRDQTARPEGLNGRPEEMAMLEARRPSTDGNGVANLEKSDDVESRAVTIP